MIHAARCNQLQSSHQQFSLIGANAFKLSLPSKLLTTRINELQCLIGLRTAGSFYLFDESGRNKLRFYNHQLREVTLKSKWPHYCRRAQLTLTPLTADGPILWAKFQVRRRNPKLKFMPTITHLDFLIYFILFSHSSPSLSINVTSDRMTIY